MNSPLHSVSVAAVITDDDGQVLVIRRRDTNKWEIPGGVLELNESIHAGLKREVFEETNLLVEPQLLTGVYKNLRLNVIALVFRATRIGGSLSPTHESSAFGWWSTEEVKSQMAETFAIRVLDALDESNPAVRLHDGVHVLTERPD